MHTYSFKNFQRTDTPNKNLYFFLSFKLHYPTCCRKYTKEYRYMYISTKHRCFINKAYSTYIYNIQSIRLIKSYPKQRHLIVSSKSIKIFPNYNLPFMPENLVCLPVHFRVMCMTWSVLGAFAFMFREGKVTLCWHWNVNLSKVCVVEVWWIILFCRQK